MVKKRSNAYGMCPWISDNFNIGTVAIPIQYQVIDCDHTIYRIKIG